MKTRPAWTCFELTAKHAARSTERSSQASLCVVSQGDPAAMVMSATAAGPRPRSSSPSLQDRLVSIQRPMCRNVNDVCPTVSNLPQAASYWRPFPAARRRMAGRLRHCQNLRSSNSFVRACSGAKPKYFETCALLFGDRRDSIPDANARRNTANPGFAAASITI